jgi:hypothetical protein
MPEIFLSSVIQESKNSTIKITIYFSLLLFVIKNRDLHESNSEIHNINTRVSSNLHTPTANLTTFQKCPFYFGINVFNQFAPSIKNTSRDIKQFSVVVGGGGVVSTPKPPFFSAS